MRRVPPERFALDLELFDEADFLWLELEVELELDESSEDIVTRQAWRRLMEHVWRRGLVDGNSGSFTV